MNTITIPDYETASLPTKRLEAPILSEREYQVMYLIASGLSVKQIADRLHLSIQTVHTYRSRIKDKLDLDSDVQIALYAVRQGIVDVKEENNHE